VDTGVVILTGEALRRRNAERIASVVAERAGDLVCATAGHHMEAMLAAYGSGAVLASYAGGSLFQGLGRPWTGLHTIDTIRRDAARAGIAFTTRPGSDSRRVEIVLHGPQVRLTYRVHLYQDWIETIVFSKEDVTIGEWTFSYPKPDEADPHRLTVPSPSRSRGPASGPNGLWLMRLAEGTLVQ
jgi:hypothetical protein